MVIIGSFDTSYDKARQKAMNSRMTTDNNPLAEPRENYTQECIVSANMERLRQDAAARRGVHGSVYAGMMSTRFHE